MTATILTEGQWGLLAAAEHTLYDHRRPGNLGCTDILDISESGVQAAMWGEAYQLAADQLVDGDETTIQLECARRVAAAQAILMFGEVPE